MKGGRQVKEPQANGEECKNLKKKKKSIKENFKVSYKHQDSEERLICLLCDNDAMSD